MLLEELAVDGVALRPEDVLLVDDLHVHLQRVKKLIGPMRTLQPGVDLTDLRDVLNHLD